MSFKITKNKQLIIFDVDETLFHTYARVIVKDKQSGEFVRFLDNREFNVYKLRPNEEYDFKEFADANYFKNTSKPIRPMFDSMVSYLKAAERLPGSKKVIIITARADMDNKNIFLKAFEEQGINTKNIYIHRAGNMPGSGSAGKKKKIIDEKYLSTGEYSYVALYDDALSNIEAFLELKEDYFFVRFKGYLVYTNGSYKVMNPKGQK